MIPPSIQHSIDPIFHHSTTHSPHYSSTPRRGGGFAEDEVGFHPGFFGADGVVGILDLLLEPGCCGGTEAVVGDIDDG
jgi:hypothetical protein